MTSITDKKKEGKSNIEKKGMPNAYVLLTLILITMSFLTFVIPSGEFAREGRSVIPGSFDYVEKTPELTVGLWDLIMAIPKGMVEASIIMFVVFFAGGMFKIFKETEVIENSVGIIVNKLVKKKISKALTLTFLTFIFGFLGATVGYDPMIPFVPIGVMIALGLGYDLVVGVALVLGAVTVGFGTSPINPYTVGTAHGIAELPVFSGMGLRTIVCTVCLAVCAHHIIRYAKKIEKHPEKSLVREISTDGLKFEKSLDEYKLGGRQKILLGVFLAFLAVLVLGVSKYSWYLTELTALFFIVALVAGVIAGFDANKITNTFIKGASELTSGALIVGYARAISVIMTQGKIADTIIFNLSKPLENFTPTISAILMSIIQGVINIFIPSGSGQAMATMPIIIPLSDVIGVNRQIAILAFQIGDGLVNLIVPTLGGLLIMLALAKVPFDRWFKFIIPLVGKLYLVGWVFLATATFMGWS